MLQKNEIRRSDLEKVDNKQTTNRVTFSFDEEDRAQNQYTNNDDNHEFNQSQNQYKSYTRHDDNYDITTESNEEYFSHDTESVDRLALDGETRSPISDLDVYNY